MKRLTIGTFVCVFVCLAAAAALLLVPSAQGAESKTDPNKGTDPEDSATTPSYNWQHLRLDEKEIKKVGKGSFAQGLNNLGKKGYRLFIVASISDTGNAGFHLFKRPPWNKPTPRPQFEYRRIDDAGIVKLGGEGKFAFAYGLAKIEKEGWEMLVATTTKTGGIGFYYFSRPWTKEK